MFSPSENYSAVPPGSVPAFGLNAVLQPAEPEWSTHRHPQLLLPVAGVVRVDARTCSAVIPAGRVVWIPGDVEHAVSVKRPVAVRVVRFWRGLEPGQGLDVFAAPPLLTEMVRHAADWGQDPPRTDAADAFFTALGGLIGRWRASTDDITLPHAGSPELRQGLNWLLGRLAHPVGPVDAALHAGLSLRTFQRRCRAELGMSPSAWLQRARVLQGLEMLNHSDLSIADVAMRCGYQSQASFGRVFKDHLGFTPVAWRALDAGSPSRN